MGRRAHRWTRAAVALSLGAATAVSLAAAASPAGAATAAASSTTAKLTVVYRSLPLVGGGTATVYSSGLAEITAKDGRTEYRTIPPSGTGPAGTAAALPGRAQLQFDLSKAPAQAYLPGTLEVVLADGTQATARSSAVRAGQKPDWTTSATLNGVLAQLGADTMTSVFPAAAAKAVKPRPGALNLAQAYVLHVNGATMPAALKALAASGAVAYAAPDWTTSATDTTPIPVSAATRRAAASAAAQLSRHPAASTSALPALPSNFALQSSEQSLLNRPGVDWTPAYEALESKYGQLPGTGETITDVSLGDLDSAGVPASDACAGYVSAFGPTTILKNHQRYIDWPSMPLIPTYVASTSATLDPAGEVCGVDPFDEEIGLDFAMMAPLPHSGQRAGETGDGLTDLLGIAPGASYRLVVPSDTTGAITSVDEAFLAAAQQTPRPNVITASLAFGLDAEGMPSRFLEDDPLTEALISSLVKQYHINVSVSANDGLRTSTNAAVAPSGGSAPTNVAPAGGTPSDLNSLQLSTAPSRDFDSGSIDAGGTTLDDIFAAPPQDKANAALAAQHAFGENRWDGYGSFSSGYGSRVNLSAPADNLTAFEHTFGGAADAVDVDNIGGTSASSQEIGAAAAVVQQTARLAGDSGVAKNPLALRTELEQTATAVPDVPQADSATNVGPQLDLGQAVTSLIGTGALPAGVARVAVEQRQPAAGELDEVFSTATDPAAISLAGADQDAWLTISPDWTGLPAGASYRLTAVTAAGGRKQLATGAWARLQPATILAAAGLPTAPTTAEQVTLDYTASSGGKVVAHATVPLTFSAVSGTPQPLAPTAPAVVTGATIGVHYDIAGQSGFTAPQLVVSAPGRMNPIDDHFFRQLYTVALHKTSGTVQVPVADLQGGGMYGIAIQATPTAFEFSDFATVRVQDAATDVRPPAPTLTAAGSPAGDLQAVPYSGSFGVTWNVSSVPGATGAYLEISAPGPNDFNSFATFNNPDGTVRDHNGFDAGSVYFQPLSGTSGHVTLSAAAAGLVPSLYSNVRVLPVTSAGTAAGEASDISSITREGVTPTDGGAVVYGFGVSQSQPTGFVTSNGANASGVPVSSVETFSEQTQAVIHSTLKSVDSDSYGTLFDGGAGMFAGNTGLIEDDTASSASYDILHPLSKVSGAWSPPTRNGTILGANNQQTAQAAFATWSFGSTGVTGSHVFSSDVQAGTFGTSYSIQPELEGFGYADITGLGQDTADNTAVVGASDFFNLSQPPTFVTVNLATGAHKTFTGVGTGYPEGVDVDSSTGTMVSPDDSGVGLYNLATGAGTLASPGGFVYEHPAADASHQEFVVQEISPPDANTQTPGLGSTPNDNALSAEVVLNETGQVLDRVEQFNFYNTFTTIAGQLTQLRPAAGAGYTLGLDGGELQPFSY